MKKYWVLPLFVSLFLISCNNKELELLKNENQQLQSEIENLNYQITQKGEEINNLIQVFNDIEDNLNEIREREKLIVKNSSGVETPDKLATIKDDILAIDALMQQNKESLKSLSDRLKTSTGENNQLKRMISNFELTVKDKELEIVELLGKLENLNYEVQDLYSSVSNLQLANVEKSQTIDRQILQMNQVWYIIASEKELQTLGIIQKKGGFLGIGKVNTLSGDIDLSNFTVVDLRENNSFDIDGKKVSLLTSHPDDGYLMRKDETKKRFYSFQITRPELFWSNSRFMVLQVD